jgi:hypothetical protein
MAKRKAGKRKTAARRELIDTGTDKRFVRRGGTGAKRSPVGTRSRLGCVGWRVSEARHEQRDGQADFP